MKSVTDHQIEKAMEDISWIKSILNQNKRVIQLIMLPTHYKWSYLVLGSSLIGFSILYQAGYLQHPEKRLLRQILNKKAFERQHQET